MVQDQIPGTGKSFWLIPDTVHNCSVFQCVVESVANEVMLAGILRKDDLTTDKKYLM